MSENAVVFKGKKNGITIVLDDHQDFETLKAHFHQKVMDAKQYFDNGRTAISFQGRDLSEEEEASLIDILNENTDLSISYIHKKAEGKKESMQALLDLAMDETITKIHKGSIRSGQTLSYEGSILILGDINPGGYANATDNIIVLGALKGQAHAGIHGRRDVFIASTNMQPTQLRIADIIIRIPDLPGKEKFKPEYAFIENNNICISPLL